MSVRLVEDDDPNEGTEQFTVVLSMTSSVTNVVLAPASATVSISDSVMNILSDLSSIASSDEQTEDNLQFISGVFDDIVNSDGLQIDVEVHID